MKSYLSAIIFSLAIIVTAIILANAYKNRLSSNNQINVTGLSSRDFVSDLIVWSGSFTKKNLDLRNAYSRLNEDRGKIKDYLLSKGIKESELVFSSVDIAKDFSYSSDRKGNRTSTFTGYRLTQKVQIESRAVDKVESISREVTELINLGVEFYSNKPEYYYTKLDELKIEMISEATENGRVRAEKMAENAGADLGGLKSARLGVFQIIAQNSNEDYSWGGSFNTWSKRKTATVTIKLVFGVD